MLKKLIAFVSVSLILASFIAARAGKEVEVGEPAPDFTLKDAHDRKYGLEKLLNDGDEGYRTAILVMGDHKVRKEAARWAMELDGICQKNEEVAALMVADLRGKPFFVTRGMIKRHIKGAKPPVPIVLDWDGEVNKRYKARQGKANVFVVDGDGRVCYRKAVSYSSGIVQEIRQSLWDSLGKSLLSVHAEVHKTREHAMASIKP